MESLKLTKVLEILRSCRTIRLIIALIFLFSFLLIFFDFLPKDGIFLLLGFMWLEILSGGIQKFARKRLVSEFFLAFVTFFSILGGQEEALAIILLITIFARYFESIIEWRGKKALESFVKLIPKSVNILEKDGKEKKVAIEEVMPGMSVLVGSGERIPVDGIVIDGFANINESALTGESALQEKGVGFLVFAGTTIISGKITIRAQRIKEKTLFGKMANLIASVPEKKSKTLVLVDRFVYYFITFFTLFALIVWFFSRNLNMVVTLFIFGSPLELVLALPVAVISASIAAFRNGVLVKGGGVMERFARVSVMIFDKTGTLTLGEPSVVNIQVMEPKLNQEDFLKLVGVAEKRSEHVLSKAIIKEVKKRRIDIPDPDKYEQVVGHGVEIEYKKEKYFLGSRHFIESPEHAGVEIPDSVRECKREEGHSIFFMASENKLLGKVCIADKIRGDAVETLNNLRRSSIEDIILLSGDRHQVTESISKELGISKFFGDVTPDKKLSFMANLQKSGKEVGMVGDGINDAPALKQADVGIAMGAMGMEPAIDAAEMVLMSNELSKIYFMRRLSQSLMKVFKQNLIVGFILVHFLGIALALFGLISPIQASFVHALVDILILINSLRLVNFK